MAMKLLQNRDYWEKIHKQPIWVNIYSYMYRYILNVVKCIENVLIKCIERHKYSSEGLGVCKYTIKSSVSAMNES